MIRLAALAALLILPGSLAVAQSRAPAPPVIVAPPAEAWEIGPVIRGRNYSVNMPPVPMPAGRGWSFDFPVGSAEAGHVHYVTMAVPPLDRYRRITLRYRIDAAPGTRFVPQEQQDVPATVSLYFQRDRDDWRARRGSEYFRWFSPPATVRLLAPGVQEMSVSLDDPAWISVLGVPASAEPERYADVRANAVRFGILFGMAEGGRGHGVFATRPARFTLLSLRID